MAWWLDRTGSGGGDEDRRWARFGGCALGHELTVCDPLGQLVDAVVSTRAHTKHKRTPRWRPFVFLASSTSNCTPAKAGYSEPQIGIEPMTARLRIGCSTTELLWRCFTCECEIPRDLPRKCMLWSGLEPLRLAAPPPQDGVSTNSTTSAIALYIFHLLSRYKFTLFQFLFRNLVSL